MTSFSKLYAEQSETSFDLSPNKLPAFFSRFVILETIFDPNLITQSKLEYWKNKYNITNMHLANALPRNAVIAEKVNKLSGFEPAMFLFPFFPSHLAFPCNPGEHVWVMFENPAQNKADLGYWFCKITEPGHIDDVNHTHAPRTFDLDQGSKTTKEKFNGNKEDKYDFLNGAGASIDNERYNVVETACISGGQKAYEDAMINSEGGKLREYETIPRFKKRPGDVVLEGTNNTLVVLGMNRTGELAKFKDGELDDQVFDSFNENDITENDKTLTKAGSIDIVAGRGQTKETLGEEVENSLKKKELAKSLNKVSKNEGDPDFNNDRSRINVSQRIQIDKVLDLDLFNDAEFEIKDLSIGQGAVTLVSDKIRLVARSDIELIVKGNVKDDKGNLKFNDDQENWAAIVIKSNGDIVLKPSESGYIKLGGDDAESAILTTDMGVAKSGGEVTAAPIISTMGGQVGLGPGQGTWAKKVLVK